MDVDEDPAAFMYFSDVKICGGVGERLISDAQAVAEDGVLHEWLEAFGRRVLKLNQRVKLIEAALSLSDEASGTRRSPGERQAAVDAIIAGEAYDGEEREDGVSRSRYVAYQFCSLVYAGLNSAWLQGGPSIPPPGALRWLALCFGELLAWAVMDATPVTDEGKVTENQRNRGIASTNPETRARWSRACRAAGVLAACAVTQLVMPRGGPFRLTIDDDEPVVRGSVGDLGRATLTSSYDANHDHLGGDRPTSDSSPSAAEPGVYIHADCGAKIRIADASGANQPEPGVIALTPRFIDDLHEASHRRKER